MTLLDIESGTLFIVIAVVTIIRKIKNGK